MIYKNKSTYLFNISGVVALSVKMYQFWLGNFTPNNKKRNKSAM